MSEVFDMYPDLGQETSEPKEASSGQALRQALDRLDAVLSFCPLLLIAVDAQGVITLFEGRGLRSAGLAAGQAVGRSLFEVYRAHPEICALCRKALDGQQAEA